MKRAIPIFLGVGILAAFAWTLVFLYNKSQAKPVVFDTAQAEMGDIVKKTVATGAIVPREEIEIKPRVSGVIKELHVKPGDAVNKGTEIAEIQIIPDMVSLNRAESAVQQAKISFDNAKQELARNEKLFAQKVISETELSRFRLDYKLKQQEYRAAISNLQLVKEGAARGSKKVSNVVTSTVDGTVLAVPVKLGESVIESNNFNAGTTIASVADMKKMIFKGKVDESEVGKIETGMELLIRIGAIENESYKGTLEYISPKGVMEEGSIQFEIEASVTLDGDAYIRAGYSANADIVLDRATNVLTLNEGLIQFEADKAYVEVEVAPQEFEKRYVETGLSDGVNIEIKSGITTDDKLKRPKS